MPASLRLRLAYFAHAISSDWHNADAHFLRGLLRGLVAEGHSVVAWEPSDGWSVEGLLREPNGEESLRLFRSTHPDLNVRAYVGSLAADQEAGGRSDELWESQLRGLDVVILHEWNPPSLAQRLLRLRDRCGYRLVFHDTHHRALAEPQAAEAFSLGRFDAALTRGSGLRRRYLEDHDLPRPFCLHEAADTTVFQPDPETEHEPSIVWFGGWGEGARAEALESFLLEPAGSLRPMRTTLFGATYPEAALVRIQKAGAVYGGYRPNLVAPAIYARAGATVQLPPGPMDPLVAGQPSIRTFEAIACGVPVACAPWMDEDRLFGPRDLRYVHDAGSMSGALRELLTEPSGAEDQAAHAMETLLARHTCAHRAQELAAICEELL